METKEKMDVYNQIKSAMQDAIRRVENSRKETEQNETTTYWMSVKMENNQKGFNIEDIQLTENINLKLGKLKENYDKMLEVGNDIMKELDEVMADAASAKKSPLDDVCEELQIASLYAKMYLFLKESEICLDVENGIQTDTETLKRKLDVHGGWERWCKNMRCKVKGVFLNDI